MTSPRRTPEEMAADRLEVARRKRAAGEARVARAESEVRAAKYALLPLLADERYAGVSEYIRCHECSPGCPRDCGCWVGVGPKSAWTAVPRLLAEREALRAEVERLHGQARV